MGGQPDIVKWAAGGLFAFLLVASLYIARGILLPIVAAAVFTLILMRAADWLGTLPVLCALSATLRRFLVLVIAAGFSALLGLLIAGMIDRIAAILPIYEQNIETLFIAQAARFGLDEVRLWDQIIQALRDAFDLHRLSLFLLNSAGSLVGTIVLVIVYSGFLIAERGSLEQKVSHAVGSKEKAHRVRALSLRIGDSISDYLATKTLINVLLAVLSYGVLRLFGIDFPLFWALMIGFLNYIPYVGSFVGVAFPVVLSLGQFGSLGVTVVLAVALTAAQTLVGNFLDPWLVGRRVNLSPFVVIVSLVAWSSIWGLPGAILAIPLTSAIAITCAEIPGLRPIAVMLSAGNDIDVVDSPENRPLPRPKR